MKLINRVPFAIIYINITNRKMDPKDPSNENVNVMSVGCLLVAALWLAAFR